MPCARKFYLIWMSYTDIDTGEIREKVPLLSCVDRLVYHLTTSGIMNDLPLMSVLLKADTTVHLGMVNGRPYKSNHFQ